MITYSNPRTRAVFTDWPHGKLRTTCTFWIESHPKKGERGVRQTVDPKTGRLSAPRTLTYARQARIVDGDDGRTYIIERSIYGTISIMRSDMRYLQASVPLTPELLALFDAKAAS